MIILDTNVISALMRPDLNRPVVEWADTRPRALLWLTTISLLEIRSGLLFMPAGQRQTLLTQGFDALLADLFEGRLLAFDAQSAEQAAIVDLMQHRNGRNVGVSDIQIAGIARARRATLATRNVKDFADLDIPLVNPWAA